MEAFERIDKIRKSKLTVTVRDESGRPVRGASVRATLKRHAFGFGTFVSMKLLDTDSDAERTGR